MIELISDLKPVIVNIFIFIIGILAVGHVFTKIINAVKGIRSKNTIIYVIEFLLTATLAYICLELFVLHRLNTLETYSNKDMPINVLGIFVVASVLSIYILHKSSDK